MSVSCRGAVALALCVFGAGCATEAASSPPPEWRLVGLYDSASLLTPSAELGVTSTFTWQPPAHMVSACGPVKHPDGLGMSEAEAVARGETPALVVILKAEQPNPKPLTSADLALVARRGPEAEAKPYRLQPMVEPRRFVLDLGWDGAKVATKDEPLVVPMEMKLIETQLRVELCMEHKTGRAWIGGEQDAIRQAYLLDPPRAAQGADGALSSLSLGGDRRHFGGQANAVPALLGPSTACVRRRGVEAATEPLRDAAAGRQGQAKGEGSLDLIPTDVWGAEVSVCGEGEGGAGGGADNTRMPLRVERNDGSSPKILGPSLTELKVHLAWETVTAPADPSKGEKEGETVTKQVALVTLKEDGVNLLTRAPLISEDSTSGAGQSLLDLLAHVPVRYPTLSPASASTDPWASTETTAQGDEPPPVYTALIVPAWQLNELLGDTTVATGGSAGEVIDGVGWALRHPNQLSVLLRTGDPKANQWVNLASGAVGEGFHPRSWGYTVGHLYGREPLVAPGELTPGWEATLVARRADAQAMFLLSASVALLIAGVGLTRVRDLWSGVPEERVTWWPTAPDAGGKAAEPPPEGEA